MKKNILHINSYYIARSFYFTFFEKLKKVGYSIRVFVFAQYGRNIEHDKVADYIDIRNNFSGIDRCFFYLKHEKVYRDIKKQYPKIQQFDICHAHSLFSNGFIAWKLKVEYGIPYIVAVRGTDVTVFFRKLFFLRKTGVTILEEASRIVFISPAHKKTVLSKYVPSNLRQDIEQKSIVIPNGIDSFWLENKRSKVKSRQKSIRLLFVGEINTNKNLVIICRAIEMLRKRGMEITFSIVGKIVEQHVYTKILGYGFVNYLGVMQKEQLLNVYNENDIFIMVSKSETFGLVYAEALTQGLPLIYSKGQGFDGFFEEGLIGYPAEADSEINIAETIRKTCDNYERLAENCLTVGERFSWDSIVDRYDRIYQEIS